MAKYRKLPVEIEAVQWNGWWALSYDDVEAMAQNGPRTISLRGGELFISTLEGEMRADVGDWIIKGVNGEIYPCKPDIFAKTYEPADIPEAITQAIAMIAAAQRELAEISTACQRHGKLPLETVVEFIDRMAEGYHAPV
jgi:hypothetical protein